MEKGLVMIKWLMGLFKRKVVEEPQKKIRLTIKDGKLVGTSIPFSVFDKYHEAGVRQQIACYEIKLNGHYLNRGLGCISGLL